MKIKIVRSFSKKVQIRQFEPIDSFCATEIEYESQDVDEYFKEEQSRLMDEFCRSEVEKTLMQLEVKAKPVKSDTVIVCAHCGGVMEGKSKDGLCSDECRKQTKYKLESFQTKKK